LDTLTTVVGSKKDNVDTNKVSEHASTNVEEKKKTKVDNKPKEKQTKEDKNEKEPQKEEPSGAQSQAELLEHFGRCKFVVGQIVKAWKHETANKLFCEEINLGTEVRKIASGLVGH